MLEEQGHLFNWTSLCASNWQATWVILPGGNNPENLQRKAPWRHPNQMPKHYYYTTTLLWAPSERPSSLPHLLLILAGLSTVSFFRLLMTIGEGWNTDRLVHRKLCLLAQLPPHHSCPVQCPHYWWCRTKPPVSSWLLQARLQTAPVHTDHWLYMVWWSQQNHVTWDPQTGYSPQSSCRLRSCPWLSQTQSETRGNLSWQSPTQTKNVFDFVLRIWTQLSHLGYIRTEWLIAMAPRPPYSCCTLTKSTKHR